MPRLVCLYMFKSPDLYIETIWGNPALHESRESTTDVSVDRTLNALAHRRYMPEAVIFWGLLGDCLYAFTVDLWKSVSFTLALLVQGVALYPSLYLHGENCAYCSGLVR